MGADVASRRGVGAGDTGVMDGDIVRVKVLLSFDDISLLPLTDFDVEMDLELLLLDVDFVLRPVLLT